ncbi:hypothetical protein SFA35_04715 [Pseudomonas sp. HR96]|uniref:hypothetical protein n=1 Tax=Pseudomonas sp. HR96 TaxID=1027966 RepID=UPI002A74B837|nr:hypothetical protein [Pseudomonas sp. HR96]WPP00683.1 hypothetical protein SFA35_04715 [Pseudomonas sp. HR96]
MRLKIAAFALLSAAPFAVTAAATPPASVPMHAQYLPPDELGLRTGKPEQQQLLQVTEFTVVVGNQRLSSQQPIPVTSAVSLRLKGKALNKGANISEVLITFDAESKSLKKPAYDDDSKTLSLNYPLGQYRTIVDLLRNDTVYVQFLTYPNGHIWADLHTGAEHAR